MTELSLRRADADDVTILSNAFIDRFMPSANGEYIKVYLYLLRHSMPDATPFSVSQAAAILDHTDNFILKALTYWSECGVAALSYDEHHTLNGITLLPITPSSGAFSCATAARTSAAVVHPELSVTSEHASSTAQVPAAPDIPVRPAYTLNDKKRFSEDNSFQRACFVTQTYFGKPLGPSQLEHLMYIYDQLGFDVELIEYLVEYCVGRGKKSMRYVEATALGWLQQGITNVTLAKQSVCLHSRLTSAVQREFGISSRSLVPAERAYIDKWSNEYHFDEAMIIAACKRTIKATGKGSFEYADRILRAWSQASIRTLDDVAQADASHQQTSKASRSSTTKKAPFPQRDYNMEDLEKQLLQ